jgi:hypothetical protein
MESGALWDRSLVAKSMATMTRISSRIVLALAFVGVIGCSSKVSHPPTAKVTGKVEEKGKPVSGASVFFVPTTQGVQAAFGTTDESGNYQLTTFEPNDGAMPGAFKIKVTKFDKPPTATQVFKDSDEEIRYYQENPKAAQPPKSLVPTKYTNEATSGLTFTVGNGPNTYDIELK